LINKNYEEIKIMIADIYEDYNIHALPIDIFELIKQMGFRIVFVSEKKDKLYPKTDSKYVYYPIHNGLAIIGNQSSERVIFVDDIDTSICFQRFSAAHELGHHELSNFDFPYNESEVQSNFFAHYLLSPTSIAIIPEIYDKLSNNLKLMQYVFNISKDHARITNRYFAKRKQLGNHMVFDYEEIINSYLIDSIKQRIKKYEEIKNHNSH